MIDLLAAAAVFSAPVPAMNYDWFSGIYDWPQGLKPNELVDVEVDNTINPYGYIQSCTARVFSGVPAMGPYLCSRLRQRGEFDPARDPSGHKMYGVYRTFVVLFNNDRPATAFPTKFRATDFDMEVAAASNPKKKKGFTVQFAVDTAGGISSCSLVPVVGYGLYKSKQEIDPQIVDHACATLPSKVHVAPARDSRGRAVPSVQNAIVGLVSTEPK